MALTQKEMIHSLSKLLKWLEQESKWGTNSGELKFITGRIGEIYTAIMTNGKMATKTNQPGYDVIANNGDCISVKTTTSEKGTHHFNFNASTLDSVDRVIIVYVDTEKLNIEIIYDAVIEEAKKLMIPTKNGKDKVISQSKILKKSKIDKSENETIIEVKYKQFTVQKLENGSIKLFEYFEEVEIVKPVLRMIARQIGVDTTNINGNELNTRTLGSNVIKELLKETK